SLPSPLRRGETGEPPGTITPSPPAPAPRGDRAGVAASGGLPLFEWLETSEPGTTRANLVSPLPHGRGSDGPSRHASILPRFFTLESFVSEALEHGLRQRPRVSGPERLLRLAAAWHDLTGRTAGPGVIHQFDRYIRDCQACRLMPSPKSK